MAFYQAQLRSILDLWIKVHSDLSLPPPDPIWPQTASHLMFEDMLGGVEGQAFARKSYSL